MAKKKKRYNTSRRNEQEQEFKLSDYVRDRMRQYYEEHGEYIQDLNYIEKIRFMSNILLEKSAFDEQLLKPDFFGQRKMMEANLMRDPNYNERIGKMKVVCSSYAKALQQSLNAIGIQSVIDEARNGHQTVFIPLYDPKLLKNPETAQFYRKAIQVDAVSEKDIFYAIKKFYNKDNMKIYNTIIDENNGIQIDNRDGSLDMPQFHEYIEKVDKKQGYLKGIGYSEEVVDMLAAEMRDEKSFLTEIADLPHVLRKIVVKQDLAFINSKILNDEHIHDLPLRDLDKLQKICNPRKTREILQEKDQADLEDILTKYPDLLKGFLDIEDDPGRIARYKIGFLSETLRTEQLGIYEYKGYLKAILDKVITPEEREHMELMMISNGTGKIEFPSLTRPNMLVRNKKDYFDQFLSQVIPSNELKEAKPYYYNGKSEQDDISLKGLIIFRTKQGRSFATYEEGKTIQFVGRKQLEDWKEITKVEGKLYGTSIDMPVLKPVDWYSDGR